MQLPKNRIFGCTFTKRSTGETRRMACRLGVTKHLKGGELAYDPAARGLVIVFDMHKRQYRTIPLEGIQSITVGGQVITP